jgi:hypothetical protein
MMKPTVDDDDKTTREQVAAQLPTHPDEKAKLPLQNVIPDGVSPPIQHPLDPLNAGKDTIFIMKKIEKRLVL